jgi:hypothetical protein
MSTMRPIRTIATAATALLLAGVAVAGCGRSQPDQPTTPTARSPAATAAPTTPAPPTITRPPTAAQAVATAISYLRREVGMADPVAGPFRPTGARTGQIDVRARIPGDANPLTGPVTTVSLQRLRSVWYVLGARTPTIRIVNPKPQDSIRSPVEVMGAAQAAVEGQVRVLVTADRYGKDTELGSGTLSGGAYGAGGEFAGQIPFRRPPAKTGSVVVTTASGHNGEVWAATVVRIRFASSQPPQILSVRMSPQPPTKDGRLLVPNTVTIQVTATRADRARLVCTWTGTAAAFYSRVVAEDTTPANGLRLLWHPEGYGDLTLQVVGPGGTVTRELGSFYHQTAPTTTAPAPALETIVGLWPVRTLAQARSLQNSVDAGHQPWLLSPEQVSISYAATELDLFEPVARQVGPTAYTVGPRNSEWVATLYLIQPVRQGPGGIWIVTRTGSPAS